MAPISHTPTTSSESTGSTAARLVLIDRISTWFIDRLTMSPYEARVVTSLRVFSWTLSNTTMVSYSEKPRIVRKAMTVAGVTSKPKIE